MADVSRKKRLNIFISQHSNWCTHATVKASNLTTYATNSDLLVINSISTYFGHPYAHHQEIQMRSAAYSCLSCCSCCDAWESGGKLWALCGECCLATFSTQCTHLATRLSSITTGTTGQATIGSGTQLDLLMMGIKMPETCWDTTDYQ